MAVVDVAGGLFNCDILAGVVVVVVLPLLASIRLGVASVPGVVMDDDDVTSIASVDAACCNDNSSIRANRCARNSCGVMTWEEDDSDGVAAFVSVDCCGGGAVPPRNAQFAKSGKKLDMCVIRFGRLNNDFITVYFVCQYIFVYISMYLYIYIYIFIFISVYLINIINTRAAMFETRNMRKLSIAVHPDLIEGCVERWREFFQSSLIRQD